MPVRETHHVVASLQPGNGGRRQLFVHQGVLATLREIAGRASNRRIAGLLRGGLFECPATAVTYLVIDSVREHSELSDETPATALRDALDSSGGRATAAIVGWFYRARSDDALPRGFGEDVAAAAAKLLEPWQTTLVMTAGARGADGAFLLWDAGASRGFRAPFYELLDERAIQPNAPKPTQMVWPSYATGDLVGPASLPEHGRPHVPRPDTAPAPDRSPNRWTLWRARGSHAPRRPGDRTEDSKVVAHGGPATPTDRPVERRATTNATPAQPPPQRQPKPDVEQADTAEGDSIERYIAIARKDGFNIASRFNV